MARLKHAGQIPIIARIVLLVALGVLAFAGAVAIHFISERASQHAADRRTQLREISVLAKEIELNLAAMRLAFVSYPTERDASMERFRDLAQSTEAFVETLQYQADDAGMGVEAESATAMLKDLVGDFVPAMTTAVESINAVGLTDGEGMRAQLKGIIEDIETELSAWPNVGQLTGKLSQVKRYEQAFLVQPTDSNMGRLRKAANEFDFALMGGPFDPDTSGRLSKGVADYVKFLRTYISAVEQKVASAEALTATLDSFASVVNDTVALADYHHRLAQSEYAAVRDSMLALLYWGGGGLLAVFILFSLLVARSIYRPIGAIEGAMHALAEGRRDVEVPGLGRRDEIGRMANAIAVFKQNAAQVETLQADRIRDEKEAVRQRRRALMEMADAFESSVRHLAQDLDAAARSINEMGHRMSRDAQATHMVGDQVAARIAEAARTMGEVVDSSNALARSAGLVRERLSESEHVIDSALAGAKGATQRVSSLSEAAGRIGEVVELITAIAAQTNLLALNATIEAARAGEAGKGFAVVAGEVKTLAQQTNRATEEIGNHVADIRDEIARTVDSINLVSEEVTRAHNITQQLNDAMSEQESSMTGISQAVDGAALTMGTVTENLEEMSSAMEASARSAEAVEGTAERLATQSSALEQELEGFLESVRSGESKSDTDGSAGAAGADGARSRAYAA